MNEGNQADPEPSRLPPDPPLPSSAEPPSAAASSSIWTTETTPRRGEAGVSAWLLIVLAAGIASMVLGTAELGLLAAVAALSAISHAIDLDPRWRLLRWITVPIVAATLLGVFGVIAYSLSTQDAGPERTIGVPLALVSAALCLVMIGRPAARAAARLLFGIDSHTARLGARIVVGMALCCLPLWLLVHGPGGLLSLEDQLVISVTSLLASLVGMVLLGLGAVGYLVRRDTRDVVRRLGLDPLRPAHILVVAGGLAAVILINVALEWVERTWFPSLWASDQGFNQLLASRLDGAGMVALALSAGIGEELTLRGALQPRLGIVKTSLLFAGLHVQYSWMGMVVIFALGLTLGWIRRRSNTTVAIAIHALYDMIAILAVGLPGTRLP
jgi:hypothetical protein